MNIEDRNRPNCWDKWRRSGATCETFYHEDYYLTISQHITDLLKARDKFRMESKASRIRVISNPFNDIILIADDKSTHDSLMSYYLGRFRQDSI